MSNERALVSMAEQFSGLPMRDLIGGPLMAAAEANNAMSITQTSFILDTCFYPADPQDPDNSKLKPIMIGMTLTRGVLVQENGTTDVQQIDTQFNLPLIAILPINALAVDNVDIAFHMEVKSSYGETTSSETKEEFSAAATLDAKLDLGLFSAEINGSVSYDKSSKTAEEMHYEKSNTATYDVKVHAGQIPIPQGVSIIIQHFANAIDPIQVDSGDSTPIE